MKYLRTSITCISLGLWTVMMCSGCAAPTNNTVQRAQSEEKSKVDDSKSEPSNVTPSNGDQLTNYRVMLGSLKTVTSPPVTDAYYIVATSAPATASNDDATAGSLNAATFSQNDLNQNNARESGYTSYADQQGVHKLEQLKESMQNHDYTGAARDADEILDYAKQTGDPDAIQGAAQLRSKIRETRKTTRDCTP